MHFNYKQFNSMRYVMNFNLIVMVLLIGEIHSK